MKITKKVKHKMNKIMKTMKMIKTIKNKMINKLKIKKMNNKIRMRIR